MEDSHMEYSVEQASAFIGKRIIFSLRYLHEDGTETYAGLWGVVESAHEDGLMLRVEGGTDQSHWAIPPDLGAFQPAQQSEYQFGEDGPLVTDVDYEMYWTIANSAERLSPQ